MNMEDSVTLTQADFDWCIKLYAAVLDWKSARLTLQLLQNQGGPQEKIMEASQRLLDCERTLSNSAHSSIGRRLLLEVTMGLEKVDGTETA